MKLSRLEVHQLPGLPAVTVEDFRAGVNFIVGDNAIGKSSLIRALHSVLLPAGARQASAIAVAAEFDQGDDHWRADRAGTQVDWSLNGQTAEPPPLPAPEALHCYWLSAQSLLTPSEADQQELSRRLRQALAGGIDLGAVRETPGLRRVQFPQRLHGELDEARSARRAQESAYRQLEAERHRLPERRAALDQARAAGDRADRLEQALAVADLHQQRLEIDRQLEAFPTAIRAMKGDELERADALSSAMAESEQTLAQAERTLGQTEQALQATGLPDQQPTRAQLESLRLALQHLRDREQAAERATLARQRAEAVADEAYAELGAHAPGDVRVTPGFIDTLEEAIREREIATQALAAHETRSNTPYAVKPWLQGVLPVIGGGVATLGGLIGPSPIALIGGGLALLGGLLAMVWTRWRSPAADNAGGAALKTAADQASERVKRLLIEQGIEPDALENSGIPRLLRIGQRLDQAKADQAGAQAEETQSREAAEQLREQFVGHLSAWVPVERDDLEALQATLEDLVNRSDEAATILRTRATETERASAVRETLEDQQTHQTKLYQALALNPGDRAGLEHKLAQHSEFQALKAQQAELEAREQERAQQLHAHPALLEQARAHETEVLASALAEARLEAERVEPLHAEIAQIEARLSQTGSDEALAEAITREQQLTETLADARQAHQYQCLGDWLLSDVETAYREQHEPALIEDARARFERFTRHEWSLSVNEAHELTARDLRSGALRPLDELSSGTRMQLLLAARVAWARDQERQTTPLPLALDETLNASDPARFRAAAESLAQLAAEEDRQILYLTARPEDPLLWESTTKTPVHTIDLQQHLQGKPFAAPTTPIPARPAIPEPGDEPPQAYAERLGVPAINPLQDAGEIHLFHLLQDHLDVLYDLLANWGIDRLGPAERWLQSPAAQHLREKATWPETLSARIRMARTWVTLARQGLGRPVGPEAIVESKTQSVAMAERIARVAQTCEGQADQLIAKLRKGDVPNLQKTRIDALADWLAEHDYLDAREPADAMTLAAELAGQFGHRDGPNEARQVAAWLASGAGR
ncbi:MAG: hypothetical protein RI514_04380 [Spiribacter sp.]|nr:hypothetical protein [Spiribacter sp.]